MSRLVKRDRSKPYAVTVGSETKWICGCGLSATQPFCDGTHKQTFNEAAGELCWYDKEMGRHDAPDNYSNIRTPDETPPPGDRS